MIYILPSLSVYKNIADDVISEYFSLPLRTQNRVSMLIGFPLSSVLALFVRLEYQGLLYSGANILCKLL